MMDDQQTVERTSLGKAHFSVLARVAMQLGRESISNSIVAISELVKNAYDADAEYVNIRFFGLNTKTPILVIEDDGNGMNEMQLRDQWMVIGTPNKAESIQSNKKKRVLTGEKGLGRLGLDRLCEYAIIRTFARDEMTGLELLVDWRKYENSVSRLEDVEHELFSIPKTIKDPITDATMSIAHGTHIILYNLKDIWTEDFLGELRKELTLLVSPFAGETDFGINLESGLGVSQIDGKIGSTIMLEAAEWHLQATVDENGKIGYLMRSGDYPDIFELPVMNWSERFRGRTNPRCGALTFHMYFFARKPVELNDVKFSRSQISSFLDQNQGIRIYRDGFRVKPYGDPSGEGDWLTLSFRRQQSPGGVTQDGWRVGYNQVVGAVFISRAVNVNLVDQTNREGLVEGPGFNDLRTLVLDAVSFFEEKRTLFERSRASKNDFEEVLKDADEKTKESIVVVNDLKDTANTVDQILQEAQTTGSVENLKQVQDLLRGVITEAAQKFDKARKAQERFAEVSRDQINEFQRQKDTLGNLASLGILAAGFGHETLGSSNLVLVNARELRENLEEGLFMVTPDIREAIEQNLGILVYEAEKIETFANFTLQNVRRDKRERKLIRLDLIVKRLFDYFARPLSEKNISVDVDIPSLGVRPIRAFEIDWESIFLNLMTNSVWAITENADDSVRKIRVVMREQESILEIRFADSGCGIAAGTEKSIFAPTFSTKRAENGTLIGTGMGLAIVKSFVEENNGGSIVPGSSSDLGGAEFVITIPLNSKINQ